MSVTAFAHEDHQPLSVVSTAEMEERANILADRPADGSGPDIRCAFHGADCEWNDLDRVEEELWLREHPEDNHQR